MFTAPTSSPLTERTRVRHTLHPVRREGNTSHARTTFPVRPASPSGTRPSDGRALAAVRPPPAFPGTAAPTGWGVEGARPAKWHPGWCHRQQDRSRFQIPHS